MAVAASLAAHAGVLALLLGARASPPEIAAEPPAPIPVMLVQPPRPPPAATPSTPPPGPAKAEPAPAPPPMPVRMARTQPSPVAPLLVSPAPAPEPVMTLSDGELVGARTAGSGAGGTGDGGQPCDMVRRLQAALRRDREVQAAAGEAHRAAAGRGALLVWNGDWIRSPGQSGKGLAGIRQAIALEVAFAPEACRAEPMRGLVLLTLADGPGAPRLALGAGAWRWSDLLQSRGAVAPRRG